MHSAPSVKLSAAVLGCLGALAVEVLSEHGPFVFWQVLQNLIQGNIFFKVIELLVQVRSPCFSR